MSHSKKVIICDFHQETNTFNPLPFTLEMFKAQRYGEGREAYDISKSLPCAFHGMIDAVEEKGYEVVPGIMLYGGSGGRVSDDVFTLAKDGIKQTITECGEFDAVFCSLHGATCTESVDDACGEFLQYVRALVGKDKVIAASFDLHANITDRILRYADVVCGYQSYPHVDFYETGYRAGSLGMRKLLGEEICQAATIMPVMAPPSGYTSLEEPFKSVIDYGKSLIRDGKILDFTMFNVQPWMDIPEIGSTATVVAKDPETAKKYTDELARMFFDNRDGYWPELMSVDEVIDHAEDPNTPKPLVVGDAADSTNGGAVGDSVVFGLRLQERKSSLRCGFFVKDAEAVAKAFEVGVGHAAEFSVGAKITPDMPGPLVGRGYVCSLSDGNYWQEGPAGKGFPVHIGRTAVLRFGTVDMVVCEKPAASGDPQILRHFGIEPKLYDLIVVKANTSFRVPYGPIAGEICFADTPGAGAANLKRFHWEKLPKNFYPFDLAEEYRPAPATIR